MFRIDGAPALIYNKMTIKNAPIRGASLFRRPLPEALSTTLSARRIERISIRYAARKGMQFKGLQKAEANGERRAFALYPFERAAHPALIPHGHMSINHRCLYIRMPQQFLDCSDIVAVFKKMCRKAVSQRMRRSHLVNSCRTDGELDLFLHDGRMNMPKPDLSGPDICRGSP